MKCACDDCCGLRNLVKRFEEDRKPDEAAAATKGLQQHKLRADWKQKRYQVRRANVVISSNDTRLHTSEISFVRPVMGTKTEVPGRASEEKPKLKETCPCRVPCRNS